MSLFPAYADQAKVKEIEQVQTNEPWLENSSFQADLSVINKASEQEEIIPNDWVILDELSQNTSNSTEPSEVLHKQNDIFVIDNTRIKEYLTVATISRPSAPKYHVTYYLTTRKSRRKYKFKRYFQHIPDKNVNKSNSENEVVLTKQNLDKTEFNTKDEHFTGFKQEEELTQKTAYYNRHLGDEPNDIKTWLAYIHFQDMVYQFEKSYPKRHAFPADELQVHLKNLVEKDKENIVLWQGYIEATQCSMSHCNTPAVISLYSKCLSTLHQLRRSTMLEKYLLEESILRMLYQCGLFLKQAGLFEQLWTLLRMYLELNLSPNDKTKFNIASRFKDKQLVELEEVVFSSHLPLHELWLRTEKLRESCHWLPYLDDDECEDPQRLVFTEDVAELIHPITMPENIFKLTSTILSLLKIPLLPCRHCTMQDLGLDYVPWSLDSIEPLLPVFFPLFPIDISNKSLLNDSRLAVGPQYLKLLPGQEEYLEFILIVMQNCADCLTGNDQTAIRVWWFRFQRLLIILDRLQRFKMTDYFKKTMRKKMKLLLKQDENRQNEIFYIEYALIEYEFGASESCINILNTALSLNTGTTIVTKDWDKLQATQCYLYRMLVQVTLKLDGDKEVNKNKCLEYLCELVMQKGEVTLTKDLLKEAEAKFKLITLQLLQNDIIKLQPLHHFLPDFLTDWLMCHGWFVFLTKGPIECGVFVDRTLQTLDEKKQESFVAKGILNEVLYKAVENYPNNLFLLSVLAKEQSLVRSMGQQWWKIQDLLLKSGRAFSILFAVIIANQQITQLQEMLTDTVTGEKYDIDTNIKNRMLALFKKITKPDMCTRRCGLVWRLYLQFVHSYFSLNTCRDVYYSAVEECPWLKALYIDAAIYIPAELSQIQDLIIEKQLRLHVTPEELDILRS
ncbi:hypothetical protein NQ314_004154 [Rhamnusium bicolor]|uniref:Protein NRDE2 homolog n=1 Tax=Rhamnusium bicolor TaxID=1586634 RepID=A0AAV8ZMM4_9CUCU|nr:hypothetical protein NQ314_004154 [Rhamnusium bicolor]